MKILWPMLREALKKMGKAHLIGYGKKHLVPPTQPANHASSKYGAAANKQSAGNGGRLKAGRRKILTQHTGLPPRAGNTAAKNYKPKKR
jgi:hypothetical protein